MGSRSTLVGRDAERDDLIELISDAPLVTVTGAGGSGKTRLVTDVAETIADRFPGGVVTAELAPLPAGAGVQEVCGQLGVGSPEAAAVAFSECPALVVLDNCEHVLDGVALFASRLLSGDDPFRVVATSREPIGIDGEHVLVLGGLGLPSGDVDIEAAPAVQMFLQRAASAGASWADSETMLSAVGELCRRLDGLPLAIELAAARARVLSPADYLSHTEHRLDLLHGRQRGADDRHRSIRAAIDVSVQLLDDAERSTFARLAVFPGLFDLELAHRVAAPPGTEQVATLELLARLVDRSLVTAVPVALSTRYRLLELLREHAVEGLLRGGEWDAVTEAFVEAMTARADQIVVEGVQRWSAELLATVANDFRNLVTAVEWCVERDETPERAFRLMLPMFGAVHQSRSAEVLGLGRRVLTRWPDQTAPWRAEVLAVLATAAVIGGDTTRATELGRASLEEADVTAIARVVAGRALGFACRATGDLDGAARHFADGRDAAASLGATSFERELIGFQASVLDLQGEHDAALAMARDVAQSAARADDPITEAWAHLVAAAALVRSQRWAEARAEVAQGTKAIEELDYKWFEGAVLRMQAVLIASEASVVGVEGGWEASVDLWLRAVEQAAGRGAPGEVGLTLRAAAALAARAGRTELARGLLEAAPTSAELSVVPDLFPEELRRLEEGLDPGRALPDIRTALRRARALLTTDGEGRDVEPVAAPPPASSGELRRDGDGWMVSFAGRTARLRDLKGFGDLARLLGRPGQEIHCLELAGGVDVGGEAGPALDDQARRTYQRRITALQEEIEEATAHNDPVRAERAEVELDALVGQLTEAFGLGGRSRPTGSATERARSAVTYRIRSALRRLADAHPELGRHLENSVRTGTWSAYRPESDVVWAVDDR